MRYGLLLFLHTHFHSVPSHGILDKPHTQHVFVLRINFSLQSITCTKIEAMDAWSSHLRGAAELVRIRGREQFQGLAGRKMFARLRSDIVSI
jgi:hypothetical protein